MQPPPMEFYRYAGKNAAGEAVRGKIQAENAIEAKKRLERMSIVVERFGEEATEEPDVPYRLADDPSKVFGTGKVAGSPGIAKSPQPPAPTPPSQPPARNPTIPPAVIAPMPATMPAPTPDSQTRLSETVEAMSRSRLPQTVKRRRQKFVLGETQFVSEEVNKLLEKFDGSVLHLAMNTDAQGKLKIAVVVEYDVQVKESKP